MSLFWWNRFPQNPQGYGRVSLCISRCVDRHTHLTASNEPFESGDLDLGSSSRFSNADTEKASEFFGTCGMSVVGDWLIRGGGGESTSSSIEDDRDRDGTLPANKKHGKLALSPALIQ
uniref:Uncharacterized protein n=1 Tax=Anopheles atroparvus TaxID=41427 RepID=A0A182INX7_ANOAO